MSTGVKVGIGLGVSLGVLGIGALIFAIILLWRRSKKKSDSPDAVAPVVASGVDDKHPSTSHHVVQPFHGPTHEIHGRPVPYELPSGEVHSPVELGTQGWSR